MRWKVWLISQARSPGGEERSPVLAGVPEFEPGCRPKASEVMAGMSRSRKRFAAEDEEGLQLALSHVAHHI
jgi:hypothetical protein